MRPMAAKKQTHTQNRHIARKHLHPKLRRSLRIYLVISVLVFILVCVDAFQDHANPLFVLLGLIVGISIGALFTRIYKISWDNKGGNVIQRMDIFGGVLIILYIAFDLSREHLVELFIHGGSVASVSLALLAGALFGRVLGSGRVIGKILHDEGVFSPGNPNKYK